MIKDISLIDTLNLRKIKGNNEFLNNNLYDISHLNAGAYIIQISFLINSKKI